MHPLSMARSSGYDVTLVSDAHDGRQDAGAAADPESRTYSCWTCRTAPRRARAVETKTATFAIPTSR